MEHVIHFPEPTVGEVNAYDAFGKRGSVRWMGYGGVQRRCTVTFRRRWHGKFRIRVTCDDGYVLTLDGRA